MRHKDVIEALGIMSDRIMKLLNTPHYLTRILSVFIFKHLLANNNLTFGNRPF